jgi:hypothetical protein
MVFLLNMLSPLMDDPLFVRRFERLRDLFRDRPRLVERNRAARDPLREILAVDEFHHERGGAVALFEAKDPGDVRMVQRREHFRLALETGEPIVVSGE